MFNKWYVPGKGAAKNQPQIRISGSFISISKYCIDEYFQGKSKARIGYDKDSNKLYIMPTDDKDEIGLTLIGKKGDNFRYLNAKNFIAEEQLAPQSKRKSHKYECAWNKENGCLIIDNVKK